MPAGKLHIVKDYNVEDIDLDKLQSDKLEDFDPDEQDILEKMLSKDEIQKQIKSNHKELKKDPMECPPEWDELLTALGRIGGIRIDNCQEVGLMRDLIHQSNHDDTNKEQMYKLFELLINYTNLWIIHFNKHKK
tara:strand:- start:1861 stop:2262 length:402 start_codon:yes stop_codon:yes gene_type:complete